MKGEPEDIRTAAFLTRTELLKRLHQEDLLVSPLLNMNQVSDASIDIRLGTTLILMKKADVYLIKPRELDSDSVRQIQETRNLVMGEQIILHPGQFVLASTLEFIYMPSDLCAFVLSRSRFGRGGLVVATATYVHPEWKGCLTLELGNAGELPMRLECGASIAQLAIAHADPSDPRRTWKTIPTTAQFAEMKSMPDWRKLKRFHRLYRQQLQGY